VTHALVVEVRLLGDRWHGDGDWPPSPFRLFQALVAGAYGGRWCAEEARSENDLAFRWFEQLAPPLVLAPQKRGATSVQYWVPNNDLDAVGNDPRRSSEIRASKTLKAVLIDGEARFVYVWFFDEGEPAAHRMVSLCDRLHTFGRGIDPAHASAYILPAIDFDARATSYPGSFSRPSTAWEEVPENTLLPCPAAGSLDSLHERFEATTRRLQQTESGRLQTTSFRQPPKSHSQLVSYDRPPRRLFFELRELGKSSSFYPIRLEHAVTVTKALRDLAFERLEKFLDARTVELCVVGRGATNAERRRRVRFVPLPSIGFALTDPSIRRMLVEIPADCPISEADMRWAVSGQLLMQSVDEGTGEVHGAQLVESTDGEMLRNYGLLGKGGRRWQTITPAALPTKRPKGRIGGRGRAESEDRVASDVLQALRHADTRSRAIEVRVQKEPFWSRGRPAMAFEHDRFERERLYHVEIVFEKSVVGPLIIGDGRWIGLGLMRPIRDGSLEQASHFAREPDVKIDDGDLGGDDEPEIDGAAEVQA